MNHTKTGNTLLSIIAICLVFICMKEYNFMPELNANSNSEPAFYSTVPINEDGSISVRVVSFGETVDVNIKDINTKDVMNINLKELGGGFVKYNGPINVRIKQ